MLTNWITQLSMPIYAVAGAIQVTVIIMVGRGFYASRAISLPEWIAYYGFATQLTNLFSSYLAYWATFKSIQGATDRVSQIMDAPDEKADAGEAVISLDGDIRLEGIDFGYGDKLLFRGLTSPSPPAGSPPLWGPPAAASLHCSTWWTGSIPSRAVPSLWAGRTPPPTPWPATARHWAT